MSSINELICDELIYWKFEISSTAQSKNQLNWASCGLDQSIETIQSMGSINNQSTDRYSRWGPPARARTFWRGGGRVWSCRLGGPPNRPARPPRQRALPLFSLPPLWGEGQVCRPNPIFSHIESAHSQLKKSALTIAPTCKPQVRGDAWFLQAAIFLLPLELQEGNSQVRFLSFYFKIFVNSFWSRMVLHAWWGTIGAG